MNAKVIVLPKRNLNHKLKLVSNDDWRKKIRIFLGLGVRENLDKTRPTFLFSRLLCSLLLFVDDLSLFSGASLYFLLALLFARYSPFYLCLFLFSFAYLSPYSAYCSIVSNFLARFPRFALPLLLLAVLVALPLSFQPIFIQNHLSTNLNYSNFPRLKSFSFAGIAALRVD